MNRTSQVALDDQDLVERSRAGDIEAFREIAARYYPLISALAYHATGNLNRSDTLACDTLVTAWIQLAGLSDPAKLRSWLCSILLRLISKSARQKGANQLPA